MRHEKQYLILNLMAARLLRKETAATKDWKEGGNKKKQLEEHVADN